VGTDGLVGEARGGLFIPMGNDNRSHRDAARLLGLRERSASRAAVMLKGRGHWNLVTIANAAGVPSGNYFVAVKIAWRGAVSHGPLMAELTDSTTTVAELKTRVLAFVRERDWEQFHSPKNLSMALAAEAGELMEHFLWATPEASKALVQDAAKRQKIADELADVVVYALEFANATGLDVAASIEAKMIANAKKYPVEKAKGRSDKYTEL
jgi:NTP pyrophosphatase (non-canonical NTP hydrolase)